MRPATPPSPSSHSPAPRRVAIVGTMGAGKTTLARRVAARLGIPHIEIDQFLWRENWTLAPTAEFQADVERALRGDAWVTDGNHPPVREIIWRRADTLIWLDYPAPLIFFRLLRRTLRHILFRTELYAGNRDRIGTAIQREDPLFIVHGNREKRAEYPGLFASPPFAHLRVVRLRSPRAARRWLRTLTPPSAPPVDTPHQRQPALHSSRERAARSEAVTQPTGDVAATNRRVWQSALPALRALNRRDLPFIILKSLPQIEELYGGPGGRLTLDVDIMVAASRIEEAFDACRAAGYTVKTGGHYPDLAAAAARVGRRTALRERKWTLIPKGAAESFDIDLHNDGIAPWRSPALRADVWPSARPCERDGIHFFTLSPEDRLLYLCWTIADEGFRRRKTRDIAQILRQLGDLDWHALTATARQRGLALTLRLVCDLTARWWAIDPPYPWQIPLPPGQTLRARALYQLCIRVPSGRGRIATYATKIAAADRPFRTWLPAARQWLQRRLIPRSRRRDRADR